ncbi:hypothetical protein BGX28_008999 [Mortierella sp. GBA30]|nr:hypothetical protein BGX28_008999 [Mortierella sp. GBA30]
MSVNRAHFVQCIFECILFEFAAQVDEYDTDILSLQTLARSFQHIADMYQIFGSLDIPSDIYIRRQGLNSWMLDDLVDYIESIDDYLLFPYAVDVSCDSESEDSWSEESSSWKSESESTDSYLELRGLSSQEIGDFLWTYTEEVPFAYHDDIASLIQCLRENVWCSRGSGGVIVELDNGLDGVKKFSRTHNEDKLDRRHQQEEAERLRQEKEERHEQERLRWEEEERRCREEEQRIQREQQAKQQRNSALNKYMYQLERSTLANESRVDEIHDLRSRIEEGLMEYYDDHDIQIDLFGSFCTGLGTAKSDADFTIIDYDGTVDGISSLGRALKWCGYSDVVTIANARVPIVTFYDEETGTECDISLHQPLGVYNSRLITTYRKTDDRFRPLFFALRHMAKRHGIHGGSSGLLTSYALSLMLITYLQAVAEPAILPRLQQQSPHRMKSLFCDGHNCTFDRNWSKYRTFGQYNTDSIAELLIDFCHYFGYRFNYACWEVNARLGVIRERPSASRKQRQTQTSTLCVMDPFIIDRNVAGNCRVSAVQSIQNCFQDAYEAFRKGDINGAFLR